MISLLFISYIMLGHPSYEVREHYTHKLKISTVTYEALRCIHSVTEDPEVRARLRDIAWHKWTVENFEKFADYQYYEQRSFNESLAREQFNADFYEPEQL